MSKINDGGPAFPTETASGRFYGMSLRDWFAGQALAGLLASPGLSGQQDEFAASSYRYADAMLAERAKKGAAP